MEATLARSVDPNVASYSAAISGVQKNLRAATMGSPLKVETCEAGVHRIRAAGIEVAARFSSRVSWPVNTSLNCTIPALTNNNVGSFAGTSGLLATTAWSRAAKNRRNRRRTSWAPTCGWFPAMVAEHSPASPPAHGRVRTEAHGTVGSRFSARGRGLGSFTSDVMNRAACCPRPAC